MLLCRADRPIPDNERRKIALFCNVRQERVIAELDVDTIYQVPLSYHEHGFDYEELRYFGVEPTSEPRLGVWLANGRRVWPPGSEENRAEMIRGKGWTGV